MPLCGADAFVVPMQRTLQRSLSGGATLPSLGVTTGRGKDDLAHKANRPIKEVLGYPLVKDFRQLLAA